MYSILQKYINKIEALRFDAGDILHNKVVVCALDGTTLAIEIFSKEGKGSCRIIYKEIPCDLYIRATPEDYLKILQNPHQNTFKDASSVYIRGNTALLAALSKLPIKEIFNNQILHPDPVVQYRIKSSVKRLKRGYAWIQTVINI